MFFWRLRTKNISSTPENPSHGLSSSVVQSLPHNILGRFSKRFDEGRPATDRQHPTALRKRLSMKLRGGGVRPVEANFIYATGVVVVVNLDD